MPDIFVIDDRHPEDIAMLQALYSRSPASVLTHLEKLGKTGSGKFMDQYYVGYGHASIGDCGGTTLFIEQVSMLFAKAVQDHPLYNGQEASTRYLDFSRQAVIDPYSHAASSAIQSRWMEIYGRILPLLVEGLKKRYPLTPAYKNEKVWENTLGARAFDIARSLLPIGTTTLLSWTTSLRAARDHLKRLKNHPLPEIRDGAKKIFSELLKKYPHSFNEKDMDETDDPRQSFEAKFALRNHFTRAGDIIRRFDLQPEEMASIKAGNVAQRKNAVDLEGLRKNEMDLLKERPRFTPLPWRLEAYGRYNFIFLLDFGSFRDLHRHRNGVCQVPLIEGQYGLNPWYLEQFREHLSASDSQKLEQEIAGQFAAIAELPDKGVKADPALSQYLYPMGTQALVHASYSVPETVYVGELRSAKTVHPSLRPVAQKMLEVLESDLPGCALYGDRDSDSWSARRGEQTIAGKS